MNKLLSTACLGAIILGSSVANAADLEMPASSPMSTYVSIFGGATFWNDFDNVWTGFNEDYTVSFDTGFIAGGAIGVKDILMPGLRHEFEVSYMEATADGLETTLPFVGQNPGGTTSSVNLLLNTWFDVDTGAAFTPYVGGGVGIGLVDSRVIVSNGGGLQWDGDDTGFAFQAGGGVKWALSESVALDLSYRFRGVLDVNFAGGPSFASAPFTNGDFLVHTVQGGVVFNF